MDPNEEFDPEMEAFIETFMAKHLDQYLVYLSGKLNGNSTIGATILLGVVLRLQNGDYKSDQERHELAAKVVGASIPVMLDFASQNPAQFPELFELKQ